MAVTSFHKETGKWLMSLGKDAKCGDTPTLSIGHPIFSGEFTTYRLPEPIATNHWGEPLFDMDDAEVEVNGEFFPRAELRKLRDDPTYPSTVTVGGKTYRRTAFGHFSSAPVQS